MKPTCASLHQAVERGNLKEVETILQNGGDIDVQNTDGNTPLHIAVLRKDLQSKELVTLLLERGANAQLRNSDQETPLIVAVKHNPGCGPLIINNNSGRDTINIPDYYGHYPLHIALLRKDLQSQELVSLMLERGADARLRVYNKETALILAIKKNPELVHLIVKSDSGKETVNIPDSHGNYPLHHAVEQTSTQLLKLILDSGAFIECKNKYGETPLHMAVKHYHAMDKARLLLQVGADVNSQANDGRTPLHLVKSCAISDRIVNMLLDWGASPTIKDYKGRTPSDISRDVVCCVKQLNIRRACVKLAGSLNDDLDLQNYKTACLEESERLKIVRHGNNSLYDIFGQYFDPKLLSNDLLKEAVNCDDIRIKFPIYCSLLQSTYNKAKVRFHLLEAAGDILKTPPPREEDM